MKERLTVRVTDIIGSSLCVSADDGQLVFEKIAPLMREGKKITLSFDGAETIISSFLNAAVGQLYDEFSEEKVRLLLTVEDIAQEDFQILKRVVENAKKYFAHKANYDRAWREEVGDVE